MGYLWCLKRDGDRIWHVSVQKYFIVEEGAKYVKRLLHIPPDEHPCRIWMTRHVVFGSPGRSTCTTTDRVILTSGEVCYNGSRAAVLNLISKTPQTAHVTPEETARRPLRPWRSPRRKQLPQQ